MDEQASIVIKQYEAGLQYNRQMGFQDKWPEYERFKAGEQWPNPTAKTKNLPRPVFNIIKFILNHKTASVANENIKMVFSPDEVPEKDENGEIIDDELSTAVKGADLFSRYSETMWDEIRQDELNEEAIDNAATFGTVGAWHYYWDNDIEGGITTGYKGAMRGEIIDPLNIIWGNPQQKNVQKQPYIIILSRDMTANVRKLAQKNGIPIEKVNEIQPDKETTNEGYDGAQTELDGTEKTNVVIKYWKENGIVWFMKVASGVVIQTRTSTDIKLYPIETMSWEKRKKSIVGVGEVEGLIPSQKAINFTIAMMMLSVQNTAWPKIYAKVGSLEQTITNTPGEIIYDNNRDSQKNIEFMKPGDISQSAFALVDKIVDLTRSISGASEAATGEPFTKDLNAAAIIALQNAAKIPIEQIRKRFYRSMRNIGRIWEEFFKVKYNIDRKVIVKDDDGNEHPAIFNGSSYKETPMRLKISVGPAANFSETLVMSTLDRLLDKNLIELEDYLEFAPENAIPFKDKLKEKIEQRKKEAQAQNIDDIISQLSPEEQQAFHNAPPEIQQQIIQEITPQ